MSKSARRTTFICLTSLCLMASADLHADNNALLRIICDESDSGAEVYINGQFKGECSLDAEVAAGTVEVRVVLPVNSDRERVFEKTLRVGAGTAKRIDIEFGDSQLNAGALKKQEQQLQQEAQRQREEAALAAQREAERQKLEQQATAQREALERDRAEAERQRAAQAQLAEQQATGQLRGQAEAGDAKAMYQLGYRYEYAVGVDHDLGKALDWYRKAAAAGNLDGNGAVADFFYHGWGAVADLEQAESWAEKAAKGGSVRAQVVMARLSLKGKNSFGRAHKKVIESLEPAVASGNRYALSLIGEILYFERGGIDLREGRGTQLLRLAAQAGSDGALGDPDAISLLGHFSQFGPANDLPAALVLYRQGADAGSGIGEYFLAAANYPNGQFLELYQKSADHGFGPAMSHLSRGYQFGNHGLPVDEQQAKYWKKKAAAFN